MTFTIEPTPEGLDFVVTGRWSTVLREAFEASSADGLVLNYARGFVEPDLHFLTDLNVRRLNILSRGLTDLSPTYHLADSLVALHVQSDPSATIELERFPHLTTLTASWHQVAGSIRFAPALGYLMLLGYPHSDLTALANLTSLWSLYLVDRPSLRSLDGLDELPWLADLAVYSKKLDDITALERAGSPVLTSLRLESCRAVSDIGPVASCPSLEVFDFSDCGEIPTVGPLRELVALQRILMWGRTKVVDGDLSPIQDLPKLIDLRMMSRPNYSPSVESIHEAISERAS